MANLSEDIQTINELVERFEDRSDQTFDKSIVARLYNDPEGTAVESMYHRDGVAYKNVAQKLRDALSFLD